MKTIERILYILQRAEIPADADEERVRCQFLLARNRSQVLEIRQVARTADGLTVIAFESPCQRLGAGFLRGLSGVQALRLLKLNASLPIGAFCILERDGQELLAVRSTQLLETMDSEELSTHCMAVAQLADQWEERIGKDEF